MESSLESETLRWHPPCGSFVNANGSGPNGPRAQLAKKATARGLCYRSGSGGDIFVVQDIRHIAMYVVITQEKTGSNRLIAKPFGHQPQDLEFPSGQTAGSCC